MKRMYILVFIISALLIGSAAQKAPAALLGSSVPLPLPLRRSYSASTLNESSVLRALRIQCDAANETNKALALSVNLSNQARIAAQRTFGENFNHSMQLGLTTLGSNIGKGIGTGLTLFVLTSALPYLFNQGIPSMLNFIFPSEKKQKAAQLAQAQQEQFGLRIELSKATSPERIKTLEARLIAIDKLIESLTPRKLQTAAAPAAAPA